MKERLGRMGLLFPRCFGGGGEGNAVLFIITSKNTFI